MLLAGKAEYSDHIEMGGRTVDAIIEWEVSDVWAPELNRIVRFPLLRQKQDDTRGSEAIAKAVRHFWPDAVQQECLVHVERGLCGKISWKRRQEVVERMNRLRGVQGAEAGEEAFGEFLECVRGKNLAAAEGLENRRDAILALHRLDVLATLNVTFLSYQPHRERDARDAWQGVPLEPKTYQLTRWMGVAFLWARESIRSF